MKKGLKKSKKELAHSGEVIIYKTPKGPELEVQLEKETVWLDAHQMAQIFDIDRTGVVRHIANIYKTGELDKKSTCAKIAQVAKDGKIREMDVYNLDMIISVGYRVNSKRATEFRIWATSVLRDHIVKGVTVNQKRLRELKGDQLKEFEKTLGLIEKAKAKALSGDEAVGLLDIITNYANSWLLLQKYDEGMLEVGRTTKGRYILEYDDAVKAISELKNDLINKKEAGNLFGLEREDMIKGILAGINQSFGGKEIYPSIEEKAAHLLYFIIKDHPFSDGNKRIGSFLFIVFLMRNNYLYNKKGEKKINDNALVALALMIAESNPKDKDIMVKLVVNFLHQ